MKDIWHEPGEKPATVGVLMFLGVNRLFSERLLSTNHYLPFPELPWCYESDLVAMLHELRTAKKNADEKEAEDWYKANMCDEVGPPELTPAADLTKRVREALSNVASRRRPDPTRKILQQVLEVLEAKANDPAIKPESELTLIEAINKYWASDDAQPAPSPKPEPTLTPAEIRKSLGFPEATVLTPCKCGDAPTPSECNGLHSFGCNKCQWMCRRQGTKAKAVAEWNKVMTEWKARIKAKEPQSALDRQVGGSHYKGFTIQPVEFSERNGLTFIEGNIIKYICRYRQDGGEGVKDLRKVIDYVEKLIEMRYPEAKS